MLLIRLLVDNPRPFRVSAIWAAVVERRRRRRDAEALRSLPDYLLDDIGLRRDGSRRLS